MQQWHLAFSAFFHLLYLCSLVLLLFSDVSGEYKKNGGVMWERLGVFFAFVAIPSLVLLDVA
jgi:hypothetical protein